MSVEYYILKIKKREKYERELFYAMRNKIATVNKITYYFRQIYFALLLGFYLKYRRFS